MSSSRERSQTTKPKGSIPRDGRLLSLIFALSRNPNRLPPRTHTFFEIPEKATARKRRIGVEFLNSLTFAIRCRDQGSAKIVSRQTLLQGGNDPKLPDLTDIGPGFRNRKSPTGEQRGSPLNI